MGDASRSCPHRREKQPTVASYAIWNALSLPTKVPKHMRSRALAVAQFFPAAFNLLGNPANGMGGMDIGFEKHATL